MAHWLVCHRCEIKEPINEYTITYGCPKCSAPKFAEDDEGHPLLVWTNNDNFEDWSCDEKA